MADSIYAMIIVCLTSTIFATLLKIHGFSNAYKIAAVHEPLWGGTDGKKKYAKTIYEIEERPKPRQLIKSFYIYSDNAQNWFSFGILFTLFQVFIAIVVAAMKQLLISKIDEGQLISILLQITVMTGLVIWLLVCFKKFKTENNRKRQLDIHINSLPELSTSK